MAMDKSKHHQLVEEAAHWIVQLSSDDESSRKPPSKNLKSGKTSEQHRQVAADIEQCIGSIQKLSQTSGHKKLPRLPLKLA